MIVNLSQMFLCESGERNGYKRMNIKDKKKVLSYIGVFAIALFVITIYYLLISSEIYAGERVLYRDDLGTYQVMTNEATTFWQKVFDTTANKTRYVFNVILLLVFNLAGDNFEKIDTILLAYNIALTFAFFLLLFSTGNTKKVIRNVVIASGGALAFCSSRFSYYTMTEVLGIMEGLALILAVSFLTLLIKDNFCFGLKYWIANSLAFIAMYVHERYFVLFGVIFVYVLWGKVISTINLKKSCFNLGFSVFSIAFFFTQRYLVLGNRILDGTSGTDIVDTFNLKTFVTHIWHHIAYIMGLNAPGNSYLNGIDPTDVPGHIYILTIIINITYVMVIVGYINYLRKDCSDLKRETGIIFVSLACIMALIVSSSVTIRVEMRWVYAPCALFIVVLTHFISKIRKEKYGFTVLTILLCFTLICILKQEGYYRSNWNNLYYWGDRELSSSLMENIDVSDKQVENITIISKDQWFSWDEEMVKQLLMPYEIECKEVSFVNSIYLVPENAEYILCKDTEENLFFSITNYLGKCFDKVGWYDDGWIEPYSRFSVLKSSDNVLSFKFHYTGEYEEGMGGEIWINGEKKKDFNFVKNDNWLDIEIPDLPTGILDVEIYCNFVVVKDSGRSESGELSCLLYQVK